MTVSEQALHLLPTSLPLPLFPPVKREEHPQIRKIKSESLDNEVLRAFGRVMTTMYKVASGKEALEMILRSGVTKQVYTCTCIYKGRLVVK